MVSNQLAEQEPTGQEIQQRIRRENKTAALWLIHCRKRKRDHEERRREILAGTKREQDENVGGGRSSVPGRPTESMALALVDHDDNNAARWIRAIEDVERIVGPKKRQLLELRQECQYYIGPDGGRPGWIAPVQRRFGEVTGWIPSEQVLKNYWHEIVATTVRVAAIRKCKF